MEQLLEKLRSYGRYLELDDSIPYWESQIPELKARIRELEMNRNRKEAALAGMGDPNFLQRIFGKQEEKKEKLTAQIREVTAAMTGARWELESLNRKIEEGRQQLQSFSGSREDYAAARAAARLNPAQESRLMMEEISAFGPGAMTAAGRVLEALEDARFWMQQDAVSSRVSQDNRKMECLARAEEAAGRLSEILSVLPEGSTPAISYLQAPRDYIYSPTSKFSQLDRVNMAIDQVGTARTQLRRLLGE